MEQAFTLIAEIEGNISGMAMPKLVYDIPCGGGKKIIHPNNFTKKNNKLHIMNFEGKTFACK